MLTDAQKTDVRRWLGYSIASENEPVILSSTALARVTLTARLDSLTAAEEVVLITTYLDRLATLETDILGASANLDTLVAGPWEANPREVAQRTSLFNQHRRDMAAFLGFAPGPALGGAGSMGGGLRLDRC